MTLQLIGMYKDEPILWNGSRNFRNRALRTQIVTKIAETLGVCKDEIGRKWHNLRCQFHQEIRRLTRNMGGQKITDLKELNSPWEFFEPLLFAIDTSKISVLR